MHANGDSERAALRAEIAELRAAFDVMRRELATTWRVRLLELERDVSALLDLLTQGDAESTPPDAEATERRARRRRAAEGESDAC